MGKLLNHVLLLSILLLLFGLNAFAQDRIITVPKRVDGAPYKVTDSTDLFGKAYRWFHEGELQWAGDSLKKLIQMTGFDYDDNSYYIVVAHYNDNLTPIGMLHGGSAFNDTRLYGLKTDKLYYVFISMEENAPSYLSVMLTAKNSPFEKNLPSFLSLFFDIPAIPGTLERASYDIWVDIREFDIPKKFQKHSDISVIVKHDLSDEKDLATIVLDNTSKEQWSFGMATAITTIDDVNLVNRNGIIVVEPKPFGDLAAFGVLNYHFQAVDTKQPTVASSFHVLGGLRLADHIEPLIGIGFGLPPTSPIWVHFFGGLSVEFANKLKSGFVIGDRVLEVAGSCQSSARAGRAGRGRERDLRFEIWDLRAEI